MSKVRIRFRQYIEAQNARVIAEVLNHSLDRVKQLTLYADRSTEFDLSPGEYLLRASLPSGEILRRSLSVPSDDSDISLNLAGTESPHEWLSLPHFLGYLATTPVPLTADSTAGMWLQLWSRKDQRWLPQGWSGSQPQGEERGIVANLQLPADRLWLLQIGGERIPMRFIALPPAPDITILLRGTTRNTSWNGGITLRIATRDAELEALMRYQATGAAESAAVLGEGIASRAEVYASEKLRNPNGAALGFYYLLSKGELNRVHEWPRNFANWFAWLPDSAVIYAMQMLMKAGEIDRDSAKTMLVRAAHTGLPVYTRGLRYLWDQLCVYRSDSNTPQDYDIDRAQNHIAAYALAVDWTEPRTTFFGETPDTPSPNFVFGQAPSALAIYPHVLLPFQLSVLPEISTGDTEAALIREARQGSTSGLEKLYRLYGPDLLGFLRARCRNNHDANDIAQETWLIVSEKMTQFDPDRGKLIAFLKYWAGIAALRWYRKHHDSSAQTMLFSELQAKFGRLSSESETKDIAETIREQSLDPEQLVERYENYSRLLGATFRSSSPPHQLLAFGFCKLLEYRPRSFVEEFSDVQLFELEQLFSRAYLREVPEQRELLDRALQRMRRGLTMTLTQTIDEPSVLSAYATLGERILGETTPRDYYGDQPEQNVSHWIYAVRRRVLAGAPGA